MTKRSENQLAVYAVLRPAQGRRPTDVLRQNLPSSAAWPNSYKEFSLFFHFNIEITEILVYDIACLGA